MSDLHKSPLSYKIARRHIIFSFRHFYGDYIITGRENLPEKGPVIYAANHLNALMDALAVISVLPYKVPIVYLGRSDMFKNKTSAKIMHFSKIMPAFRMRDGMENLEKNMEIFHQCVDLLDRNISLGIMPEGNQGGFRRLRPLVKGIFRIAFTAQRKYGTNPGVKIVPIGIDYKDFENFGKHIILNIGKPIEVSQYMAQYEEDQVKATNQLRKRLSDDLIKLTLHLATNEHYDCFETATEVGNTAIVKKYNMPNKTLNRFFARQKIARKLVELEKRNPETIDKLDQLCAEYRENLRQLDMESWLFEKKRYHIWPLIFNMAWLAATLPVFLTGFVLNMIPFFTPDFIIKKFRINFPGGTSSVRFGIGMLAFPVFYLIQAIVLFAITGGSFWKFLVILPAQYFLGKLAYQWYRSGKKLVAKFRFRKMEQEKSPLLSKTKNLHKQIVKIIKAA